MRYFFLNISLIFFPLFISAQDIQQDTLLKYDFRKGDFNTSNFLQSSSGFLPRLVSAWEYESWGWENKGETCLGLEVGARQKGPFPFDVRFTVNTKNIYDSMTVQINTVNGLFTRVNATGNYTTSESLGKRVYSIKPTIRSGYGFGTTFFGPKLCTDCGEGTYTGTASGQLSTIPMDFYIPSMEVAIRDTVQKNAFLFLGKVSTIGASAVSVRNDQETAFMRSVFCEQCARYLEFKEGFENVFRSAIFADCINVAQIDNPRFIDVQFMLGAYTMYVLGHKSVVTGLRESLTIDGKEVVQVFDLHGRSLEGPAFPGQPVIVFFSNGVRKLMVGSNP